MTDDNGDFIQGMDVHSSKCSKVNLEINRWLDNEANQTPAEAFQHVCQPRFSDLDGHGHVKLNSKGNV